ncbi:MAG TPA: hypothetical protein VN673_12460, partial [Clostridia bacterium]|nr:hypothetical protein [Clostridia bacterium]
MAKKIGLAGAARGGKGLSGPEGGASSLAAGGEDVQLQIFRSLADRSQEFIGICDLELKPFYVN